jgi:hypothetical protein
MPDTDELPPMPDRHTGQPRPPRAPARDGKDESHVPWNARRVPQPPDGEGPVLEWHYKNRESQLLQFGIAALIVVVFGTVTQGGLTWTRHWALWGVVIATGMLVLFAARTQRYSAGADWFMHRKEFVKTYELTSIKYTKDFGDGDIDLDDHHGGGVKASLTAVWDNPDLWDLVYNGIRHSVANGAQVNDLAVTRLRLYDVVRLRDQRRGEQPSGG